MRLLVHGERFDNAPMQIMKTCVLSDVASDISQSSNVVHTRDVPGIFTPRTTSVRRGNNVPGTMRKTARGRA